MLDGLGNFTSPGRAESVPGPTGPLVMNSDDMCHTSCSWQIGVTRRQADPAVL